MAYLGVCVAVAAAERVTFRDVFAVGEFRALWSALALSVAGDQLARVALSVMVFDRTQSALLSAAAYAATYLPYIIGGFLLAGLADRLPRREVMIACDAARAVLIGVMVIPGEPMWLLIALVACSTLFSSPFSSARAALYPEVLRGERYALGTAVTQTTITGGMVFGFVVGGVLVAAVGARFALGIDAATFVVSGLIVWLRVHKRPAAADVTRATPWRDTVVGTRLVFSDQALRTYMLLGWLIALYAVAEGLAAPYAAGFGGGSIAVGLILAAGAFGTAIGSIVLTRLVDLERRIRWMGPLAVACSATIMLCALRPGLAGSLVIFAISGAFGGYQVAANTAFVLATPDGRRSQAFGIAHSGMLSIQGLAYLIAGAVADFVPPAVVIAGYGAAGTVAGLALTAGPALLAKRRRTRQRTTQSWDVG